MRLPTEKSYPLPLHGIFAANMKYLVLLLFFSCSLLHAQVNLIIEDETEQGLFLAINGYLQHPEKQGKLVITHLDTIPYQLHIDSDTFRFNKTIHLREQTGHRYVLVKDFHGDLKLRYRGTSARLPAGYATVKYNRSIPYEDAVTTLIASSVDEPPAETKEITKEADEAPTAKEVTINVKPSDPPSDSVLLVNNDTISEAGRRVEVTIPTPEPAPFEAFIARLAQKQYEFEKLVESQDYASAQKLTVAEIKQVFGFFKYDNTRLQFLKKIQGDIRDPANLGLLKDELEYEISKQELQKLIDGQ